MFSPQTRCHAPDGRCKSRKANLGSKIALFCLSANSQLGEDIKRRHQNISLPDAAGPASPWLRNEKSPELASVKGHDTSPLAAEPSVPKLQGSQSPFINVAHRLGEKSVCSDRQKVQVPGHWRR